jgi:hypothetical protein
MSLRRPTDRAESELIRIAEEEIRQNYGDVVSVARKAKTLFKFGANDSVGTSPETIWATGGDETYINTNAIDKVSSSSGDDTGELRVEGHVIDANYKSRFTVQTVTLTGTTKATLATPLSRVTRLAYLGTADLAGTVYCYEDDTTTTPGVPDTAAKIHAQATAPQNQTLKCATTISDVDYWIITDITVGVKRNNSAAADFEIQIREIGNPNQTFRSVLFLSASTEGPVTLNISPPLIVPRNHDFRIRGVASTTAVALSAGANGFLAKVIGRRGADGIIREVA